MVYNIFSTNPHFDSFVCFTLGWGCLSPALKKNFVKVSKKHDIILNYLNFEANKIPVLR